MKKNFIIFMFLMLFNINSVFAEEVYYFEQNISNEIGMDFENFYTKLCRTDPNSSSCMYVCESDKKDKWYSADGSGFPSMCSGISDIKMFRLSDGSFKTTETLLKMLTCDSGTKCWKYISDNYCKNYLGSKSDSSRYKLCSKITNNITNGTGGENKTCSFVFNPSGHSKDISFNIALSNDSKKILISVAENIVDGTSVIFDDTTGIFRGYSNVLHFYEKDSSFNNFTNEYIKTYNGSKKCPVVTFCLDEGVRAGVVTEYNWYASMNGDSECKSGKYKEGQSQSSQNGDTTGIVIEGATSTNLIDKNNKTKLDCDSLFHEDENGEYLFDLIKLCINLVKIFVPLALFAFGVLDMAKAVFAGDAEKMRKVQSKFIMRMVIAVAIFLIPTMLKLVLTVGSTIWDNIDPNFCGLL